MRTIHISHYILKSNKRNLLDHSTTMVLVPQLLIILCSSFSLLPHTPLFHLSVSISLTHTCTHIQTIVTSVLALGHSTMVLVPQLLIILCSLAYSPPYSSLSSISLSLSLSHTHAHIYRQSRSLCLHWSLWSSQPKWSPVTLTEISTNQRNQALLHFQHLSFLCKNTTFSHARWNNPLHVQTLFTSKSLFRHYCKQSNLSVSLSLSHKHTHAQLQKDLEYQVAL